MNSTENKSNNKPNNKNNRKKRNKKRKSRKNSNAQEDNATINNEQIDKTMDTSQEIEQKELHDKVEEIKSKPNGRPGNFGISKLDSKRYSGSEYEEFHTPSYEFNPIAEKADSCASDKDISEINKQWEDIGDFDNECTSSQKVSINKTIEIKNDEDNKNVSDKVDDDNNLIDNIKINEIKNNEDNKNVSEIEDDDNNSIDNLKNDEDIHNVSDKVYDDKEEYIQPVMEDNLVETQPTLNEDDVKDFLKSDDNENVIIAYPESENFMDCLNHDDVSLTLSNEDDDDIKSAQSEIILTEDCLADDIIDFKGYATLEYTSKPPQRSMKLVIRDTTGSIKQFSDTSVTNVTSITDSNSKLSKSESKTSNKKSSNNFVIKVWKRFKKRKNDNKKTVPLTPTHEEIIVDNQAIDEIKKEVSEKECLSITSRCDTVQEIGSNQAVQSIDLDQTSSEELDKVVQQEAQSFCELPAVNIEIKCESVIKNEIIEVEEKPKCYIETTLYVNKKQPETDDIETEENPFIEFDKMLNKFETDSKIVEVEHSKVQHSFSPLEAQISQQETLDGITDLDIDSDDNAEYINDDYLFPDAITPTKIVEFDPPDSYDVPYMDDRRFDDDLYLICFGETKPTVVNVVGKAAPLASMDESILIEDTTNQPCKSTSSKKIQSPFASFRTKRSFGHFFKTTGRSR